MPGKANSGATVPSFNAAILCPPNILFSHFIGLPY
jgi:hypothetical protein